MRTEMKTRNGQQVFNITKVGDMIIGFISGKAMVWNKDGRRSSKNRSQLDLQINQKYHIAVRKWGNTYKTSLYDSVPKGKGIIKVIEVEF
jgi:hypothetical protein